LQTFIKYELCPRDTAHWKGQKVPSGCRKMMMGLQSKLLNVAFRQKE
jgi:hypothetical protein